MTIKCFVKLLEFKWELMVLLSLLKCDIATSQFMAKLQTDNYKHALSTLLNNTNIRYVDDMLTVHNVYQGTYVE